MSLKWNLFFNNYYGARKKTLLTFIAFFWFHRRDGFVVESELQHIVFLEINILSRDVSSSFWNFESLFVLFFLDAGRNFLSKWVLGKKRSGRMFPSRKDPTCVRIRRANRNYKFFLHSPEFYDETKSWKIINDQRFHRMKKKNETVLDLIDFSFQ